MDDVICAICIAALYNPRFPLQCRDSHGTVITDRPLHTIQHLKDAADSGIYLFEPGTSMAIGVWATTFVKGVSMCATHALYVVHRLDLARL